MGGGGAELLGRPFPLAKFPHFKYRTFFIPSPLHFKRVPRGGGRARSLYATPPPPPGFER